MQLLWVNVPKGKPQPMRRGKKKGLDRGGIRGETRSRAKKCPCRQGVAAALNHPTRDRDCSASGTSSIRAASGP